MTDKQVSMICQYPYYHDGSTCWRSSLGAGTVCLVCVRTPFFTASVTYLLVTTPSRTCVCTVVIPSSLALTTSGNKNLYKALTLSHSLFGPALSPSLPLGKKYLTMTSMSFGVYGMLDEWRAPSRDSAKFLRSSSRR